MARLFVAVWPDAELVSDLMGLPRKDRRGLHWVKPENWHVTLRFLGDADIDEVTERLSRTFFESTPVQFGPGIDILQERAIVLPANGLDTLAAAVAEATTDLGTEAPRKRFRGHLTLARMKSPPSLPEVIGARLDATQTVTEVALVKSKLRTEGAEYETVATFEANTSNLHDTSRNWSG